MFNSAILDVAIGIIFVYLLLSLICSAANELIESKLKNRAKNLEAGIRNLLGDKGLADQVYSHGLINGLFSKDQGKPSYIPSRIFALALLNIIAPDGIMPSGSQAAGVGGAVGANPLVNFREAVAKLPATAPVQKALLALIDDAQGDINKLRTNVENWYDSAMDRVAGWYKRRVHTIILFLGLGVVVGLNADSVYIARHLSTDPALRNSLVSAAQVYAQKENPGGAGKQNTDQGGSGGTVGSNPQSNNSAQAMFNDNLKQIKALGLPIGWSVEGDDPHLNWPTLRIWKPGVAGDWYNQIRFHWLGWILTALAISLGAPFWFDTLNKFIVVRSTVKPREKSREELSKD